MELKRYIIHDTRLGLFVTAPSIESANLGVAALNQAAGYPRFAVRTITEVK